MVSDLGLCCIWKHPLGKAWHLSIRKSSFCIYSQLSFKSHAYPFAKFITFFLKLILVCLVDDMCRQRGQARYTGSKVSDETAQIVQSHQSLFCLSMSSGLFLSVGADNDFLMKKEKLLLFCNKQFHLMNTRVSFHYFELLILTKQGYSITCKLSCTESSIQTSLLIHTLVLKISLTALYNCLYFILNSRLPRAQILFCIHSARILDMHLVLSLAKVFLWPSFFVISSPWKP